jgi:hypothetical protein
MQRGTIPRLVSLPRPVSHIRRFTDTGRESTKKCRLLTCCWHSDAARPFRVGSARPRRSGFHLHKHRFLCALSCHVFRVLCALHVLLACHVFRAAACAGRYCALQTLHAVLAVGQLIFFLYKRDSLEDTLLLL